MKLQLNRSWCKAVVIGLAFILAGIAVLWGINYWEKHYNNGDDTAHIPKDTVFVGEQSYEPQKHIKTVLVIGLDKFAGEEMASEYMNDKVADFLMLLIIDEDDETCKALQIDRDTITNIQTIDMRGKKGWREGAQISLSHTYGDGQDESCRNVVDTVEYLLYNAVKIDHYISFTMDSVAEINDIIGGVTLPLLDDFTYVSPDYTKGKEVHLMGDMALTYVRGRQYVGDETNVSRMARQRQYLAAFNSKLADMEKDDELFVDVAEAISEYMVTDCTIDQLSRIYEEASQYFDGEFLSIKGESVVGEKNMEFHVDEEALYSQVIDLFYTPVDAPADTVDTEESSDSPSVSE